MKTLKKLTALILAIVMCVALCSCTLYETIKITEDGKVTMQIKYAFTEAEAIALEDAMKDDTAMDDIIKTSNKKGWTQEIDGVKYYYYMEDSEDEEMTIEDFALSLETPNHFTTTDFWLYATGFEADADTEVFVDQAGINMHVELIFTLPYKVVETNATKVDDYTISFDETMDGKYIYAITEKSTDDWTKAEDKSAVIKEMAKKQCTPKKVKKVKVNYKKANALAISWKEAEGGFISGYIVERKVGNGEWAKLEKVGYLSLNYDFNMRPYIVDKKVEAGKTYSYRVKAYYKDSEFDLEGACSSAKSIKVADLTSKPSVKLSLKKDTMTIKVKKFDKTVDGYQIKYSTNKNFKGAKTVNTKTAKTVIKGLDTTKVYYVKVRKFVKSGNKKVYGNFSKSYKIIYA